MNKIVTTQFMIDFLLASGCTVTYHDNGNINTIDDRFGVRTYHSDGSLISWVKP
jgi:hypothetical protein